MKKSALLVLLAIFLLGLLAGLWRIRSGTPKDAQTPSDLNKPSMTSIDSETSAVTPSTNNVDVSAFELTDDADFDEDDFDRPVVARCLRWLGRNQITEGPLAGTWPGEAPTAGASLGLLAYLSTHKFPTDKEHGRYVNRSIDYLIRQAQPDGSFAGGDSNEFSHALATWAVAQGYGTMKAPGLRPIAERALERMADKMVLIKVPRQGSMRPVAGHDTDSGSELVTAGFWRHRYEAAPILDPETAGFDPAFLFLHAQAIGAARYGAINVDPTFLELTANGFKHLLHQPARSFVGAADHPFQADPKQSFHAMAFVALNDSGHIFTEESRIAARGFHLQPFDPTGPFPCLRMYAQTKAWFWLIRETFWEKYNASMVAWANETQDRSGVPALDGSWAIGPAEYGRIYETSVICISCIKFDISLPGPLIDEPFFLSPDE